MGTDVRSEFGKKTGFGFSDRTQTGFRLLLASNSADHFFGRKKFFFGNFFFFWKFVTRPSPFGSKQLLCGRPLPLVPNQKIRSPLPPLCQELNCPPFFADRLPTPWPPIRETSPKLSLLGLSQPKSLCFSKNPPIGKIQPDPDPVTSPDPETAFKKLWLSKRVFLGEKPSHELAKLEQMSHTEIFQLGNPAYPIGWVYDQPADKSPLAGFEKISGTPHPPNTS